MSKAPKAEPLYVGLTLRGKIQVDEWERVAREIEAAIRLVVGVRITAMTLYVGDEKIMEFKR